MRLPKKFAVGLIAGLVVLSFVRGQQADQSIQPPATALVPAPPTPPPPPGSQLRVQYSDIPRRVQIVGKLGQPLGQLVTVRGRWTAPYASKPGLPVEFVVDQVNGRPLDLPARFDRVEPVWEKDQEVAKKTEGEEWEFRGVETGGFVGFSDEVWEELGQQARQRLASGFLTRFCYLRAMRVDNSKPAR